MIKKKHHYVWRNYLREWSNNDQIYCKRYEKIFKTKLENIAQEKYFYRITELSIEDIELMRKLFIEKMTNDLLKELNDGWIKIFDFVIKFRIMVETEGVSEVIREDFENQIVNFEEEMQSKYEDMGAPYLKMLKNGEVDFYSDDDSNIYFNLYLSMQYFRTKRMQSTVISESSEFPAFHVDRIWKILVHLFATNLAGSLYLEKSNFHCVLLFNKTNIPFITGDQPIVNTYAIYTKKQQESPKELELFYPLSPMLGILVTKKPELETIKSKDLTADTVELYNTMISSAAVEQLYGNSELILEKYHLTTASS